MHFSKQLQYVKQDENNPSWETDTSHWGPACRSANVHRVLKPIIYAYMVTGWRPLLARVSDNPLGTFTSSRRHNSLLKPAIQWSCTKRLSVRQSFNMMIVFSYAAVACSSNLVSNTTSCTTGTITSPQYPTNYMDKASCQWLITSPDSNGVGIEWCYRFLYLFKCSAVCSFPHISLPLNACISRVYIRWIYHVRRFSILCAY